MLYKLLQSVSSSHAKLMVIFAVVSVPVSLVNLQNKLGVLPFINGEEYTDVYSAQQLQSQVMLLLDRYDSGILIAQLFWGLWLFPFGYLVYKSGFLPKILGVLLIAGCFGYLINTFGETIIQGYNHYSISKFIAIPASLGEIGICLWLLIFGVKNKISNA